MKKPIATCRRRRDPFESGDMVVQRDDDVAIRVRCWPVAAEPRRVEAG